MAIDALRRAELDLCAEEEIRGDPPLDFPAGKPVVPIARAGIEPVATTAVGGPVTEAFLQPDGQKDLRLSVAEVFVAIARGDYHCRIKGKLRAVIRLVHETVFHPDLRVSVTEPRRLTLRLVVGIRDENM